MNASKPTSTTRREFIRSTTTAAAALAMAAPAVLVPTRGFAQNSDTLKVGLVGCGGRGSGAAGDAIAADSNLIVTALGDAFDETVRSAATRLKAAHGDRVQVPQDKMFSGLDAFKKVIDSDIDVVLLASPPGFRPEHLRYAIEKGKHVFCEKPVATDSPGVRHVLESVRMSKEKKLNIVTGFCWRYDMPRRALYEKVHEGALGQLQAVYGTYLTGPVKPMTPGDRKPAGMSDLEWQIRHWMNFNWLAGDGYVEQCIHTVDKLMWAFQDKPPAKCSATGGRVRVPDDGNIFDHMTVVYEWPNGARGIVAQRQIPGCYNDNSDFLLGTEGRAVSGWGDPVIRVGDEIKWRYRGEKPNMYVVEHQFLYRSIRKGEFYNDGEWMASSTLAGIMGRMAAYTGQEVTWEQALNSKQRLVPEAMTWDMAWKPEPLAIPGITKLV